MSRREAGFALLSPSSEELASSYRLEQVGSHKDPFDRLLIWQCMQQDLLFLTADADIAKYSSLGLSLA